MKLISASLKYIARSINDQILLRDKKLAQKNSYHKTGVAIRQAKQKSHVINGAKTYRKYYEADIAKATAKYNNRDKFISDL